MDSSGNVYVADTQNNRIQKFNASGGFITKWGSVGSGDGQLYWPNDIAVDNGGNVYVVDRVNSRIQKFSATGVFISKWGSFGTGDGQLYYPDGLARNSSGNVYVVESSNRIQKFSSTGVFISKWGSVGSGDGQFSIPERIAVDSSGNVYVADFGNHRIQKFSASGGFITKWGSSGTGDGEFNHPDGIAVDNSGNVYVADTGPNSGIQKFNASGGFITKWGSAGSGNGQLMDPRGIAVDSSGNVYVADTYNNRIQKFRNSAAVTANIHNINKGTNYTTIQAAINDASPGDEIRVDSGTYYENVNVTKQLTLHGIGDAVVNASGSGSAITLSADGITLEGFTATGAGCFEAGIKVTSSNSTLIGNKASKNYCNNNGIFLYYSSNNTLSGNSAFNNDFGGISLSYSNNNILNGNNASNNGQGIMMDNSNSNTLNGNTANLNKAQGIMMQLSNNNTLSSNTANSNEGWHGGIYLVSSNNNTISVNNASNNLKMGGIKIEDSSNNTTINGNNISNNYYGIYMYVYPHIYGNNTIYNNFFNNINNYYSTMGGMNKWNVTRTPGANIVGGLSLGGNVWAYPNGTGFSQTCIDSNKDGICDLSYMLDSNNIDYLPLAYNTTTVSEKTRRIAFVSMRDGNEEIYIMNEDGSGQTRITHNTANDSYPYWSPDTRKMTFSSNRDGNWEVYVMNADGSGQTDLTRNPANDGYAEWSPDGQRIVFVSDRDSPIPLIHDIYTMDVNGNNVIRLTDNSVENAHPAWSPDGQKIAFASDRDGYREIYVMNADGSGLVKITNTIDYDDYPTWSPDGTKIAFASSRDSHDSTKLDIYIMNANGANVIRLTNNIFDDRHPSWSPDGNKIAFASDRDGNREIYVMNADGTGATRLTNQAGDDQHPAFIGNFVTVCSSGCDYARIQDAINASSAGDTILVYSGTYYENVNVNKQLTLRGIGMPVVDAGGNGSAIMLAADGIRLEGFTATAGGSNIVVDAGIKVISNDSILKNNTAYKNWNGIFIYTSKNNTLIDNYASNNNFSGIVLIYSNNNTLTGNNASNNYVYGFGFDHNNNSLFTDNIASNNSVGIGVDCCSSDNIFSSNSVSNNNYGIVWKYSNNNNVYHNSFINNTNQATDNTGTNSWHSAYPSGGNYWSDYTGFDLKSGPSQNIPGSDGIGDTPYNISGGAGAQDRYPFMRMNGWQSLSLNVEKVYQYSDPWGKETYDTALNWKPKPKNANISRWGCALTSTVMVLKYHGVDTDPSKLNNWLNENNGYINGNINWYSVAKYSSGKVSINAMDIISIKSGDWSGYKAKVDDALQNGHPVIAGVYMKIGKTAPDHWVVITGKTEKNGIETYAINDPAIATRTTLIDYGDKVYGIRIYKSAIKNNKVLQIIGKSPIELYITDPQGRHTGINPLNGSEVNEIPNSSYYYENIADEIDNESSPDIKIFEVPDPVEGSYNISVIGTDTGNYSIDVNSYDELGNQTSIGNFSGNTSVGNVQSFEIKLIIQTQPSFDTGPGTYPSIWGVHNGTITLNQTLTVHRLYTYPSPGTGGHSEYVRIWNSTWNTTASWSGYIGDWHNITFAPFALEANVTYNYTIVTGSYPQIIHNSSLSNSIGTINSTEFIDANGKHYSGWIPAIRLG